MLRREAARWLARLQSGRDPDVQSKFRQWCDSDRANAAAFERVRQSYELAGLLRQSSGAIPAEVSAPAASRSPRAAYALAAATAFVVVAVAVIVVLGGKLLTGGTEAVMLTTRVGEIRSIRLSDGSRVTLDTATSVEVDIDRAHRGARLEHGRARFEIADTGEPFVIRTKTASATTGGGTLDVEQIGAESRVDVLAGTADVRSRSAAVLVTLDAGDSVTADRSGTVQTQTPIGGQDWTRGMLQFDGTPLPAAVALANRYSNERIVIDGDLHRLRVTGAFRAGDTAGLATALAEAFHLSLGRTAGGGLILSPESAPAPPK